MWWKLTNRNLNRWVKKYLRNGVAPKNDDVLLRTLAVLSHQLFAGGTTKCQWARLFCRNSELKNESDRCVKTWDGSYGRNDSLQKWTISHISAYIRLQDNIEWWQGKEWLKVALNKAQPNNKLPGCIFGKDLEPHSGEYDPCSLARKSTHFLSEADSLEKCRLIIGYNRDNGSVSLLMNTDVASFTWYSFTQICILQNDIFYFNQHS